MFIQFDRVAYQSRVVEVRRAICGTADLAEFAGSLEIPVETWMNYEAGVLMPDYVLLRFLCLTNTAPYWLLTGEGDSRGSRQKPIIQMG